MSRAMQMTKRIFLGYLILALAWTVPVLLAGEQQSRRGDYRIGKGDVLEINVWKEEDLTRTVTVRNDGKISLPLLDDIQAAGKTPMELKAVISNKLSSFIEGPVVTVIVKEQGSQRIYIIGEVKSIGEYVLNKDLTVVQALALAGGFTEWAKKDKIVLLRRSQGKEQRMIINYDDIVDGEKPGQNILLQADDTIIVR